MSEKIKEICCPVCRINILPVESISCKCPNCKALINLKWENKTYQEEGGQAVPGMGKRMLRISNAKDRFDKINRFVEPVEHTFIDIGCGSGEMLETGLARFGTAIGFEPNRPLAEYSAGLGLTVVNGPFDNRSLPDRNGRRFLFSICHVLEHLEDPVGLLRDIDKSMQPGDLIYIEVPSCEGLSFKTKGYNWRLWTEEHLELWSEETGNYVISALGHQLVSRGRRIFSPRSISTKQLLKYVLLNPFRGFEFLNKTIKDKGLFADFVNSFFADYIWIIMKKV